MKTLRRIFLGLLKTLGATLAAVLVLALVVFFFPGTVIRDATLPWAKRLIHAFDADVNWKQGHWSAKSDSLWRKRLKLKLDAPCYRQAAPLVDACLERISLEAVYDLRTGRIFVEKLDVPAGKVFVEASKTAPAPKETKSPFEPLKEVQAVRGLLASLDWKHVEVKQIALLYSAPETKVRAQASIVGKTDGETRDLKTGAEGTLTLNGARTPVRVAVRVHGKMVGPLDFGIEGYWGAEKQRISAEVSGRLTEELLEGKLRATMANPAAEIPSVGVEDCRFSWQQKNDGPADISLNCPVSARLSANLAGASLNRVFRAEGIEKPIHAEVTAKIKLPDGDFQKAEGNVQLTAVDLRTTSLEGQVHVSLDVGAKSDPIRAEVQLTAPDFSALVGRLQTSPFAIPAPLNQLDGRVSLNVKGRSDLTFQQTALEFSVASDLASDFQKLAFSGDGTVGIRPEGKKSRIDFAANVTFGDTKLSLPRLDPTRLPQLLPDPSIVYPRSGRQTDETIFHYRIAIRAGAEHPVVLHTNQFSLDIPVQLDLLVQDGAGMTGSLKIPKFKADLFRRNATVRRVVLKFPRDGAAELTARVDIHYAEYELTLQAFGMLDAPRFTITSNPPLSENSALSLLLFGRPLEELSPGQGESLGNARAALTSGAISAASMYLLASTPIESIGYDPSLGRFSATVRLVEGTSLRVESAKEGVTQLGIRKRLGRDWVLNTYVERTSPLEDRRSVSTFLEWSKTY